MGRKLTAVPHEIWHFRYGGNRCCGRPDLMGVDVSVDGTELFSLRENAIAKEPGSGYPSIGGVCLDSAGEWWLDSLESSPYGTVSRGASSASSLVTPIR
jgi:hypothetical protein